MAALTKLEVEQLVDKGYALDQQIKKIDIELKQVKVDLKQYAQSIKESTLEGNKSKAVFSDFTSTSSNPKELHDYLKKSGRLEVFWELIGVKIADARKILGELAFDSISTSTTVPFYKVKFKKK